MATPTPERSVQPQLSVRTLDYLSHIDLSTLTQSELLALSRSSSAAVRFSGDIAVASIDRSTFNESAGSRRQTFFRPGPSSPSSSVHHRSRVAVAGRLSSSFAKSLAVSDAVASETSDDPHNGENRLIIANLKQCLRNLPEFYDIDFDYVPLSSFTNPSLSLCVGGERKRKRGRKPKPKPENLRPEIQKSVSVTFAGDEETETGLEIVNKNGVRVDLAALASLEDPYGPQIRRRTEGMCGEQELLGFLSELGGEWCSRRRKRKIVDAGVLGDFLPVAWKLLLALKRKERRAWVYCRRIVSPGGRHFLSCKEVSEYLQSYFEIHGEPNRINQDRTSIHLDGCRSGSEMNQDATLREDSQDQSGKYHTVSGSDNLEEVQVQNLFKCQKCNSTFNKNDEYLQHLVSAHLETTNRCKLGSLVEDGETITDGNHDEGNEQQSDKLSFQQTIEPTSKDESGLRISRMDALIEIAHNSMLETSSVPATEATGRFMSDELNLVSKGEQPVSGSENEMVSPGGVETEDGLTMNHLDQDFRGEINENTITCEKMENLERVTNVAHFEIDSRLYASTTLCAPEPNGTQSEAFPEKHWLAFAANRTEGSISGNGPAAESGLAVPSKNPDVSGVINQVNSIECIPLAPLRFGGDGDNEQAGRLRIDFGQSNDTVSASIQNQESLSSQLQTCENVSKGEDISYSIDQSNDRVVRYGELQLDYMDSLKLNFVGNTSISLVPMGLEESTATEGVVLGMSGGNNNLTTSCMWCGIEFSHELEDSEPRSDSVGYVCLTCKARISRQIGTPDATNTSTMTSHLF